MEFSTEVHNSGAVKVEMPERFIIANRTEFKQLILAELGNGRRNFVLDFRKTEYIDSSGLGTLYGMDKEVRRHGGAIVLTSLCRDLRTLMSLTKFDTIFRIQEAEETSAST